MVKPNGYLVKPFEQQDLYTAIEIALSNFSESGSHDSSTNFDSQSEENTSSSGILKDSIFVKKQHLYYRIPFKDIMYIKADNVYLEVYTKEQMFLVRSPLKDYLEKLPSNSFFRSHKSYIINVEHVMAVNAKDVLIGDELIPISKDFKDFILKAMNL